MYNLSPVFLARGAAAALAAGVLLGGLWGLLLPFGPFLLFGLMLGVGLGYAVGEAVSVATNRKAGWPLQAMAVGGVILAYVIRSAIIAARLRSVDIGDVLTQDLFGYAVVVLGSIVAVGRFR